MITEFIYRRSIVHDGATIGYRSNGRRFTLLGQNGEPDIFDETRFGSSAELTEAAGRIKDAMAFFNTF